MRITKAALPCPVCGQKNETDKISVSFQPTEVSTSTIVEVDFFCTECRAEYNIKIDLNGARNKLGECFGCISNTGDFVCKPECGGCDGTKNYKCGVTNNE